MIRLKFLSNLTFGLKITLDPSGCFESDSLVKDCVESGGLVKDCVEADGLIKGCC